MLWHIVGLDRFRYVHTSLVLELLLMSEGQDRYRAFLRMARQYAFIQCVRRAGRGHDPAGLAATKAGECLVNCWACPHDGRNLPPEWREVDPKYR